MSATITEMATAAEPYVTMPAPLTVRVERRLPGPVERVWSYLTDSEKRAKWFAGGPMDLREAGAVTLTFRNTDLSYGQPPEDQPVPPDGVDHVTVGLIIRCEPPHLLSFNWAADGSASETTFELSADGADTRLVVTHSQPSGRGQLLSVSAGWHVHLGILIDLLSETKPRSFWPEHSRLRRLYDARFAE